MTKTNKILIFVFIALFVITIGEIGYYFLFINKPKTLGGNIAKTAPSTNTLEQNGVPASGNEGSDQIVSEQVIQQLKQYSKKQTTAATLTTEFAGTITDIRIQNSETEIPGFGKLKYRIFLQLTTDDKNTGFFITDNQLKIVRIIDEKSNSTNPIDINNVNLKSGDNVKIRLEYNLLKELSEGTEKFDIIKQ